MEQLKRILASLSGRQRVTIATVLLLLGAGLYSVAHWRTEADFRPLVTGLAPEDSAAVLQKLKESGAEYRLSESGGVISVPSAKLAELRLELAGAGLPKSGRIGFEIFDKTNLGATDFVEHVNFRRALEGELERSLTGVAGVEQARVHVTFPKDSVFLDNREAAKASVMVKLRLGTRLSPKNVLAIGHLVASAVEGLSPDAVSIMDMQGNLLSRPSRNREEEASEHALEYRQKVERDLTQKISDTLDPLLGHERYRAGVSADCDLSSGEQSEETLDPSRSVMVSSQKTEDIANGGASTGVPGTASNLPRPTSKPAGSGSTTTRRTESVNYESSRTIRKVKLPQGAIKRVTVAVLLDHKTRWEGAGQNARRILEPPSPETLKTVKDVVAAVIGFSPERGDQITVEALPFEGTMNNGQPADDAAKPAEPPPSTPMPGAPVNWKEWKNNPMLIPIAAGAGALLLLVAIGALVMRGRRKKKQRAEAAKALAAAEAAKALSGPSAADKLQAQLAEQAAAQDAADRLALASIKVPTVQTKKTEVLTKQLRENAKKDSSASVHVLQTWIHDRS